MENENTHKDRMELKHEAVPGYRPVFIVVFTAACLYMGYILFQPCF